MNIIIRNALATSAILLLIGMSIHLWWNLSGINREISLDLPASLRAEVHEISSPDRLRQLSIMLMESQQSYSKDMNELLDRLIDFLFVIAAIGAIFVWVCTLGAAKQLKLKAGEPLGWLKWF